MLTYIGIISLIIVIISSKIHSCFGYNSLLCLNKSIKRLAFDIDADDIFIDSIVESNELINEIEFDQ